MALAGGGDGEDFFDGGLAGEDFLETVAAHGHVAVFERLLHELGGMRSRVDEVLQGVRDVAAALGIGAEVLATRRDVEAIAYGLVPLEQSPLLRGWRREVLGETLRTCLARGPQ